MNFLSQKKNFYIRILFLLNGILFFGLNKSIAQKKSTAQFILQDSIHLQTFNENYHAFNWAKDYADTSNLQLDLSNFLNKMLSQGYLSASVDSIIPGENLFRIYFYVGNNYEWSEIRKNNIDEIFLE